MNARHPLSFLLAVALPFASVLASTTSALADDRPPAAVNTTPVTRDARIARFALTPHGHVTAIVLQDGATVRVPHRMARGPVGTLKAGDLIRVQGQALQTPTGVMITRAIVQKDGVVIADASQARDHREKGQRGERGKGKREHVELAEISASGRVAAVLSSPRGHVHALLLDDGTTASGRGLESLGLKVGDRISVAGKGGTYTQGKAVHVKTVTMPNGEVRTMPKLKAHRRGGQAQGAPV